LGVGKVLLKFSYFHLNVRALRRSIKKFFGLLIYLWVIWEDYEKGKLTKLAIVQKLSKETQPTRPLPDAFLVRNFIMKHLLSGNLYFKNNL
jgi:hypothetical protein